MSQHRQYLSKNLFKRLQQITKQSGISTLICDERTSKILNILIRPSQIFGCGIKRTLSIQTLTEFNQSKAIVFMSLSKQNIQRLQKIAPKTQIYLLNSNTSNNQNIQFIKNSKIKKNVCGIKEVNIDFIPYIDTVYQAKTSIFQKVSKVQSLTSFLLSFQKFYEFQIYYPSTHTHYANLIKQNLQSKLTVLQRHNCAEYQPSNKKIRVLTIDRCSDLISPLITSFIYGPIIKQMQAQNIFNEQANIFNKIFDLDFLEVSNEIDKFIKEKKNNRLMDLQLNSLSKAKEVITKIYQPEIQHSEIDLHIKGLELVMKYCKKKSSKCVIEQTLANGVNEDGISLSGRDIVKEIRKWVQNNRKQIEGSQYFKVLVIANMIYSFWFFDSNELNQPLSGQQKVKLKCLKGKYSKQQKLQQKQQDPDKRKHFYRHQPNIFRKFKKWVENKYKLQGYQSIVINKSQKMSQFINVIHVDGPLGYYEMSLLRKYLRQLQLTDKFLIHCEQLTNNQQYLNWLISESNKPK